MADVERVEKKGKRTYKSNRPPAPTRKLFPVALEVLRYLFAENEEAPSVTTVLGVMAKPALIGWAAREERKMVSAFAGRLYNELYDTIDGKVPVEMFVEMLQEKLGKGAHLQLLAKASNVGSEVHARIEWEFKGELGRPREPEAPPLTSDQAVRSFQRWTEWRAQVNLKVVDIEKRLHSSVFNYGGTLDLLAEVDVPLLTTEAQVLMAEVNPRVRKTVVIDFKTGKAIYAEAFLQNIAYRMALQEEGIETQGGIIVRLPKYDDDPEFDAKQVPEDPLLAPTWLALLVVYRWWEVQHPSKKARRTPSNTVDNTPESMVA